MRLSPDDKFGPYTLISPLGEGGMGEVWKARDTRLNRTVALKVAKANFGERFEREAHAVAALNHPHICTLHDVGPNYLVMEFLEGGLLKGPLPLAKAVEYGSQILDALEAAHRAGIVHRDLKPSNVLVTKQGAKLLDFGLAKQGSAMKGSDATLTSALTSEGQILGTLQYMSPEQLQGQEADARSDIFAFGCVLYEMLTGQRAFAGTSAASVIAAIIERPAPSLSGTIPAALDRLLQRCLAKDPEERWQCARDLRAELLWTGGAGSSPGIAATDTMKHSHRERLPWLLASAAAALLLGSLFFTVAHLREHPAAPSVIRFQVPAPDKLSFDWFDLPAVSPDGERIAFTASDKADTINKLFVRPLNASAATTISLPGSAYFPFWSPDGRQIAFGTRGTLQKVDVAGGPPIMLCECTATGGTWNSQGVIVASIKGFLHRLPAAGGEPKPIAPLAKFELSQRWPQFLPDGKRYLFLSMNSQADLQGIYAGSLDGGERKFILPSTSNAVYLSSGHLLFMRGDVLMAQPFDLGTLKLHDEPRPISDHVQTMNNLPGAVFSASPGGVLVWRNGTSFSHLRLQWFDRNGNKLGVVGEGSEFSNPALSPDERRVAIGIMDSQAKTRDIWVFDLLRGARTRLTFDPGDDLNPAWSPDGTRIAFTSSRKGERDIYQKRADGSGPDQLILEAKDGQKNVEDWSSDGKYLLYNHQPSGRPHLYLMPLEGDRTPIPFVKTAFRSTDGQFSPNSRWISYNSDESGRNEVYVQGLTLNPSQAGGKWQVSTAGGSEARWRRDGRELYYFAGRTLMAVDVKTDGPTFEAGIPKPLFDVAVPTAGRNHYVVTKDGQRFLVVTPFEETSTSPLQVLVNWR